MVAVKSTMQALGQAAPDFSLPDVSRQDALVSNADFIDQPMLIMFICNHCPYVIHVMQELTSLANDFVGQGFAVVAISSNDVDAYPQDGPDKMRLFAEQYRFAFPYCFDQSQQVAQAYDAACTPDFFVYDAQHKLRYRGQMDGARPGNAEPVNGADLRAAMTAVLAGDTPPAEQLPSMGCNIKWREE